MKKFVLIGGYHDCNEFTDPKTGKKVAYDKMRLFFTYACDNQDPDNFGNMYHIRKNDTTVVSMNYPDYIQFCHDRSLDLKKAVGKQVDIVYLNGSSDIYDIIVEK